MNFKVNSVVIEVIKGDITEVSSDAIVNAANSYLRHGGGVAGAIVKKGGYVIQEESDEYIRKYGPVSEGEVAVTTAGKLSAKYVIHAVGPVYGDPQGDEKLKNAIKNVFLKAEELKLTSIAIPAISTGIFGYPYKKCAKIMVNVIKSFKFRSLKKVIVCLYTEKVYKIFLKIFTEELNKKF